tara:strand:- start:19024 stop:19791 length:768 start_codon:yes stop_codon:yes gene_type:complete
MYKVNIDSLVNPFSSKEEANEYLRCNSIPIDIFKEEAQKNNLVEPNIEDLARLHFICKSTKPSSILEFGSGFSTYIFHSYLSDLDINDYDISFTLLQIFEVHKRFLDIATKRFKKSSKNLKINSSICKIVKDLSRDDGSHYYEGKINYVPQIIYLDGPSHHDIPKLKSDADIKTTQIGFIRSPISSDILKIESWLEPATILLIDGRIANVRYLKGKFYRNWEWAESKDGRFNVAILNEKPLGYYNSKMLTKRGFI